MSGLLENFIRNGRLELTDAYGRGHRFGGQGPGPTVHVRLHDPALHIKLLINPELHAGEAYMAGTLTFFEGSSVGDLLNLFSINRPGLGGHTSQKLLRRLLRLLKRWQQANPIGKAAQNARHHYDLSTDFYRLFLDEGLNYSCAFFDDPETDTLDQAQHNKLERLARKLDLQPGMTVAEIGSGWGSLAIHLAQRRVPTSSPSMSRRSRYAWRASARPLPASPTAWPFGSSTIAHWTGVSTGLSRSA